MLKEYHPIEVVIGADGSLAVEGVPEGRLGARKAMSYLFDQVPTENTYTTNPLWDWLYFPPETITEEQRERIRSIGLVRKEGSWVYKLHEVEHVEQPGAYTESFFEILKEPWLGRLVAGIVSVVLFVVAAYFWLSTREPSYAAGGFSDVLTAAESPYHEPRFVDRLAVKFSDGDHFGVPIQLSEVLHRGPSAVIFESSSDAYLVRSDRIGESIVSILQLPGAALKFDTRGGKSGMFLEHADGSWKAATIHKLHTGSETAATPDREIRYTDETTFASATTYAFEGGIEKVGGDLQLYRQPRADIPYRVVLNVEDPGLAALFEYVSTRGYAVGVTGTLEELAPRERREADRVIGRTGTNVGLSFARRVFVPAG